MTSIEHVRAPEPRAADGVEAVIAFKVYRPGGEPFKASDISTDSWRSKIENDCDTGLPHFEADALADTSPAPHAYRLLHLEGLWSRAAGAQASLVPHVAMELTIACPASADDAKGLELSVFTWGLLSATLWEAGFRVARQKVKLTKTYQF